MTSFVRFRQETTTGRGRPGAGAEYPTRAAHRRWRLAPVLLSLLLAVFLVSVGLMPGLASAEPQGSASDGIVRDLVGTDHEIASVTDRLSRLSDESDALAQRVADTQVEVAAKRQKLTEKRMALSSRVRDLYVNGRTNNIEMLFSSTDFTEFLQQTDMLKKITSRDAVLIDSVRSESQKLADTLGELKQRKGEVDGLRHELEARRSQLEQARAQRQALLAKAGSERPAVEGQSAQIETKIQQLNPSGPAAVPVGRRSGRYVTMVATGYCPLEPGLSYGTATGMRAQHGVVAVDPRFMPLGTRLFIDGYGYAVAGDTGSAIKGNRIDLCFDTMAEMGAYGWRVITVEILD